MSELLKHLTAAGEKDLESLRARIKVLADELESLRLLERAIDTKLHGPRPGAPSGWARWREKRKASAVLGNGHKASDGENELETYRARIVEYLRGTGAAKLRVIAADCNIPAEKVKHILGFDDFQMGQNGMFTLSRG